MTRIRKILTIIAATLLLSACIKNEVNITFELGTPADNTYSVHYYASDRVKGALMQNYIALHQGKGELKCVTVNPTLAYVRATGSDALPAVIYMERGDKIKITGATPDPLGWKVEGNRITGDLTSWRLTNEKVLKEWRPGGAGSKALNDAVAKYVKENASKPAAAIILLVYYDRREDPQGFERCRKMLKGDAADAQWQKLVPNADMISGTTMPEKLPARILLKTPANGCDTVVPGRVPALIYFSKNIVPSYTEDLDMLRTLDRDYPDSAHRVLVDVSMEPDSMVIVHRIRTDSLKGVVRAWMPLGISDDVARELGVTRVPYVIVIDAKKQAIYRGDDMHKAEAAFRKLMPANK